MSTPIPQASDPAEQLLLLWQQGQQPDVDVFVKTCGPIAPAQLAGILRVDQRERWHRGERIPAESYLLRHLPIHEDPEAALDLIFNEFLLRDRQGETPKPEEFARRFPQHAAVLRDQISLHHALAADPSRVSRLSGGAFVTNTLIAEGTPDAGAGLPQAPRYTPSLVPPVAGRSLPEVFGRYRILRQIGQGGMGTVYLARDTQLERQVALKVPRFGSQEDIAVIKRFYREARMAAGLTHPNLCPIYDVNQVDGIHFLTMPFVEGESLAAYLKREGPLPQRDAAELTAILARALAVAHRTGVVHRDLKPGNVMLALSRETSTSESGLAMARAPRLHNRVPIVTDFGLARQTSNDESSVTALGIVVGTPAYLAPEQIDSNMVTLTHSCDIYSLGVMLYEMLTGRLPFQGHVHQILNQALTKAPDPPSSIRSGIDPRLEAICLKAMAKKPAERFATMEQFAEELEQYLQAPSPTLPITIQSPQPIQRRQRYWILAGLVALALLVAGWLLVAWWNDEPPPNPRADLVQTGTRWVGDFWWDQDTQRARDGDVQLLVEQRDGGTFRGRYLTESQQHQWLVEGTLGNGRIEWKFVKTLTSSPILEGTKAKVSGSYNGDQMEAIYQDEKNDVATLKLHLEK